MDTSSQISIQVLIMMYGIGFLGVLAHWVKSAAKGDVTWNLFKYLFIEQKGSSTSMIVAYAASMYGLQTAGMFDAIQFDYIKEAWNNGFLFKPFLHAIIEASLAGYACDSIFNKGNVNDGESTSTSK